MQKETNLKYFSNSFNTDIILQELTKSLIVHNKILIIH